MNTPKSLEEISDLLLQIASLLMISGANTNRVNTSISRFASVLNCEVFNLTSQKTIILTITDNNTKKSFTRVKNIPPHKIDFAIISRISNASWNAISGQWTFQEISEKIDSIKEQKKYSKYITLIAVSFSGAGFCNIFGGDYLNMLVAFFSTLVGLFVLQFAHKKQFNGYISVFLASFIASMLACTGIIYNIGTNPEATLATSILFLVPGVALINSFTDLLDKNVINGMVRFTHGVMTVLSMALGLFLAMLIFQIK
ncbi:threonine/serine exporter family protein [uncultured Maribacter sp.]|uniref:threonine/serine ThrE exporter family protein n=1 Tax=uncultured Maribacter sp. TaxID=431308 RepID=UPI0026366E3A|nr:threonine/serine exporter family protein [uncultured Maribacter sp.]